MNIYLIGFMGSGKTTLGKLLASKLRYDFTDTDALIEEAKGCAVKDIFSKDGEHIFRQYEHEVLQEVLKKEHTVVATGGGLPCFFDSMKLMNDNGTTVYLKTGTGVLFRRLVKEKKLRPLISELSDVQVMEFITHHLQLREPYYMQAKIKIEADDMKEKNLAELLASLRKAESIS